MSVSKVGSPKGECPTGVGAQCRGFMAQVKDGKLEAVDFSNQLRGSPDFFVSIHGHSKKIGI